MHIQPYFPEPEVVSRNAASERYIVTLSFIRAVMAGHFVSALAVVGVALLLPNTLPIQFAAVIFLGCLVALTLVRRLLKGGPADNLLSLLLMAPTVWSLGSIVATGIDAGLPLWVPAGAYTVAGIYGAVCGRDFSFVGQFMVTLIAMTMTLPVAAFFGVLDWPDALLWGLASMVYVFFYVYDLAALLSRRRLGEEPAAVADMYRDLLNFLTYSVRIVLHWRRFRFI